MLTIRTTSEGPTVAEWTGEGQQNLETRYTKSSQFQTQVHLSPTAFWSRSCEFIGHIFRTE